MVACCHPMTSDTPFTGILDIVYENHWQLNAGLSLCIARIDINSLMEVAQELIQFTNDLTKRAGKEVGKKKKKFRE